jgi:hypothetical protein
MGDSRALTREEVEAAVSAVKTHKTISEAARVLGIPRKTLHGRMNIAARTGLIPTDPVMPGFEISRVSTVHNGQGTVTARHIQQKPERGEAFTPPPGHMIKGVSALLDGENRTIQRWIKTRDGAIGGGLVEALQDAFRDYKGAAPATVAPSNLPEEMMTVYPIADLHLSMMAWGKETGEDYDLTIGSRTIRAGIGNLMSQGPAAHFATVAFLGDIFHQNDATNRTPRSGHQLDVDGRYPKVLRVGADLSLHTIACALQSHHTVYVEFVPGNHDPEATAALHLAISLFYQGNPRVIVGPVPASIIYRRWGVNLFGLTHGENLPPERMAHAMAADRPQDWGETTCRRFFSGHYHREASRMAGAVKCESVGSPIPKDAYTFAGGWRSERIMRAFHYHATAGETGTTSVFIR